MANGNTNLMGTQFSAPSVDLFGFPIPQLEWQDPYGAQAFDSPPSGAFAPENPDLIRLSARNVDPFDPTQTYPDTTGSGNISMYQSPREQRGRMSEASAMGIIGGLGGIAQGLIGRGRRREEQRRAGREYREMRRQFEGLDTGNIYADVRNQYTGMENPFEDLTINQQQAEFQRQMFAEQQASTLQAFRGAAGASGIAALAQAMAGQAQRATQIASASIGQQESRNQALRAQEASRIQQMERMGEAQAEQLRLAGEEQARSLEWQKTGTLLGMAQQRRAAADQAQAQADAALWGGVGSLVGGIATSFMGGGGSQS